MIQNLFPSQIWKCKLNITEDIKNDILKQIISHYEETKSYTHPVWKCKVHTSLHQENYIDYSQLAPYIKSEYDKFSQKINLEYHEYHITDIWYNYYMEGCNQEVHDHVAKDCLYSAVYFLKLNDTHPSLTFYNNTKCDIFYKCNREIKYLYNEELIEHSIVFPHYTLNLNEGDFVIFPSYLPHCVFVQKTNDPRITISMNFYLTQKVS